MSRHSHARRASRWRAPAAALAAAALAAAAPAEAQRKDAAPRAAPVPARTAAPAAAVPLPPPPAGTVPLPPADAAKPRGAGSLAVAAGAWSGFDRGSSVALQVDYGIERTPASWRRLGLEYRVSVLLARPTEEVDLTRTVLAPGSFTPVQIGAGAEETRSWVVEVVPTARVRMPFERLAFFADGGLGLAQTLERREREETFEGRTTATENVTGLVARLGAGMTFDLSPRTRLLFQPVALSLQLGPSYSAYVASLGLSYRL